NGPLGRHCKRSSISLRLLRPSHRRRYRPSNEVTAFGIRYASSACRYNTTLQTYLCRPSIVGSSIQYVSESFSFLRDIQPHSIKFVFEKSFQPIFQSLLCILVLNKHHV